MVDHNAAAAKQIDSMTDKVAETEVAGSGAAVQNLQAANETTFLVPDREDLDVLQKNLKSSRW